FTNHDPASRRPARPRGIRPRAAASATPGGASPMSTPSLPAVDPTDIWWEELPSGRGRLPGRAHLRSDAPSLNLDGTWQFRYGTRADGSDLGEAAEIQVPGLWQLQGYG